MKKESFDVFVIGSGVAGKAVAEKCAQKGLKVAIAENRELGGTCSNRGCDPKKVLLGPTEIIQRANDLMGKGISKPVKLDFKKLQKFKKTFTHDIPERTKHDFEENNVKIFSQTPKFTDARTLQVADYEISANKIVIATGMIPRNLDIEGSQFLKHSDDFLLLKKVPKKIIFLGAGYVGMEFAQLATRAGSEVTIIENGKRPLQTFDEDLVAMLLESSKKLGIRFIFNAKLKAIQKKGGKLKLEYTHGKKKKSKKANIIFNTTGRVPSISMLNLDAANIDYDKNGIMVDSYLRSKTNKDVYACGDVSNHSLPLSPLAGIEGNIVSKNILSGNRFKIEVPVVPSVVFTIPNIASVGYSEKEARKRYKNVSIKYAEISDKFNNKRVNGEVYAYKIIINDRTDVIVGAHILAPESAETINLFVMAMNLKTKSKDLRNMIFTYPSWSNDIKSMLS